MKILLLANNKSNFYPSIIPPTLTCEEDLSIVRTGKVMEHIWKNGIKNRIRQTPNMNVEKAIMDFKDRFCYVDNSPNIFYYYDSKKNHIYYYMIKDEPLISDWTILVNDSGFEYIHFFSSEEKYRIVNEDLKYGIYV